jgi:hypothetical protein
MSPEETAVSTVTIIVVDKKESLVFEKTDDTKENFIEAVGMATYSNSKPTVVSYISIFESLWTQVDLYEQLKTHDKMQKGIYQYCKPRNENSYSGYYRICRFNS